MNLDMKTIGERIKTRRLELNLKQNDIKDAVGISSGNLSEIENGNRTPSMVTLYRLADVLECSIDWIVKGESPKKEIAKISHIEDSENEFLSFYLKLSSNDQEEILDIMKLKISKYKMGKSYNSGTQNSDTKMA